MYEKQFVMKWICGKGFTISWIGKEMMWSILVLVNYQDERFSILFNINRLTREREFVN